MSPASKGRSEEEGKTDEAVYERKKKRRLSRREQKARKKQRKQQEQKQQKEQHNHDENNNDDNGKSKSKSKKKKNKKNKKKDPKDFSSSSQQQLDSTRQTLVNEKLISPDNGSSNNNDAWKVEPVQEDIPYIPTTIPGGGDPLDAHDKNNNPQQKMNDNPQQKKNPKPNSNNINSKALGKWFPKARVLKSQPSVTNRCTILLFYQYKSPQTWSTTKVTQLIQYLQDVGQHRPTLGGRLRVAPEGINATISCGDAYYNNHDEEVDRKMIVSGRTILEHFTKDLQQFDTIFKETDFKYIPAASDRHFKDLKILPVQELVFYGLQESQAPLDATGVHLDATDFHQMLQDQSKPTVVVDVRNHYEAALGRFDGQQKEGGAKYIDPLMRKSTDFPSWLEQAADDLKGKRVMMYCTGGVRCERASAYLKKTMGDSVDGVFQLQGGIERYMQAFPDGGYWRGSNFVFDKRESVSSDNPNGDGGVLVNKKKNDSNNNKQQQQHNSKDNDDNDDKIQTYCCLCDRPWDRYVGKKKCETCGVPVLMCDKCMTSCHNGKKKNKKKKKKRDKNDTDGDDDNTKEEEGLPPKLARCPLCVDQNITVPVDEVEYTANGVKSKSHSDQGKAAPSVLKWGGGHATEKKQQRRRNREAREKPVSQEH